MLKYRILTAAILIPLAVALVFFAPPVIFCGLTGGITLWAFWEWSAFVQFQKKSQRFYYLIISYLLMTVAFVTFSPTFLMVTLLWWLFATGLVIAYPGLSSWWGKGMAWRSIMGWLVLIPCWVTINFMRNVPNGAWMLLYLFVLVWGADSGAYFVGRQWGKHKLAAQVS